MRTVKRIEILTFSGCPHAEEAVRRAQDAAARLAPAAAIVQVSVGSEAEARRLQFIGSPTVRVDGTDIEGREAGAWGGSLSCRLYDEGAGVPAEWLIEAAILRALEPRGVLFLCVANSARSQMAEGIARSMAPPGVALFSAGSQPSRLNPLAVQALAEIGIDIASHRAKAIEDVPAERVDAVITLCAEEICPIWLGRAARAHWGLPDPAAAVGDDEARLAAFRSARDEISRRLSVLFRC